MNTTHTITHTETLLRTELRAIEGKLGLYDSMLIGTPFVVELFPGLYLVPEGTPDAPVYSARGIVDGVMMYSAEGAARAVAACVQAYPHEFAECRAVHVVDALRTERESLRDLLRRIEEEHSA